MTKEMTMAKKQTEKKTSPNKPEAKGKARARKGPRAPAQAKKDAPNTAAAVPAAANSVPAAPIAPQTPDLRLPAPGTVLQKKDRHGAVRCECTIEEGGIRYAGKVYRSLSSAAMAAAKDLGLTNKTQNGFVFWGLSKAPRRPSDPLVVLDRAWERYHGNVEALVKEGVTDENRSKVLAAINKHASSIESLRERMVG
jgi:hypothetical protein